MKKLFVIFAALLLSAVLFILNDVNAKAKEVVYKIGDKGPGGGFVFYDKGDSKGGWRYLEAAPEDAGYALWGCAGTSITGAQGTAIGTGKDNTKAILKNCKENGIAAKLCADYRGGGKNDWFLPSKDELKEMYNNLKKAGIGEFGTYAYLSSSEGSEISVWVHSFYKDMQFAIDKQVANQVRPARAFK